MFTTYVDDIVNRVGRPKYLMHIQFSGHFFLFICKTFLIVRVTSVARVKGMKWDTLKKV